MKTWHARSFQVLSALVSGSGLAYLWLKYGVVNDDPFSLVNHPWQPLALQIHLLASPLLIFVFGVFWESHISAHVVHRTRANRWSGFASLATFPVMAASGYILQVSSDPTIRRLSLVIHIASGLIFTGAYVAHQIAALVVLRRERVRLSRSAAALLALLGLLFLGTLLVPSWLRAEDAKEPAVVTRQLFLMGTRCTVAVEATDRKSGIARLEHLIDVLESTERQLTTWNRASELALVNEAPAGLPVAVSPSLFTLFVQLVHWRDQTAGAFDPAVGPLIDAWDVRGKGNLPNDARLADALEASGLRHFELDTRNRSITRTNHRVWVDSGGFGKGEALDRLASRAREQAMPWWAADLGGQLIVGQTGPETRHLDVDLAHPLHRTVPLVSIRLGTGSLATSGGAERDLVVAGERVGHIIDPNTGRPVNARASVTVWHPSALVADILSTALYVLGPTRGIAWAERRGLAVCFLLPKPQDDHAVAVLASGAFKSRFGASSTPHAIAGRGAHPSR